MFESVEKHSCKMVQTIRLINKCVDSETMYMLRRYQGVMAYILKGTISKESPAFKDWLSKLHEEEKNKIMAFLDRLGI